MKKIKKQTRTLAYIFLLINTICWGAAAIISKPALDITTPFRFLMYRYLFTLPFVLPLLWSYRQHFSVPNIKKITALELLGTTFSLSLFYIGLAKTGALEASILATTTPIFIVLAGVVFLKEKQDKHEWLGLSIAFIATLFLTIVPAMGATAGFSQTSLLGNTLIISQNIAIALYFIIAKRWYASLPKLFVTTISYLIGFISFLVLSIYEVGSISELIAVAYKDLTQPTVILASLYMAIFGSIIGLTAYIKGQDGIEASEASFFWYLQPLVYVPLGYLILNEQVSPAQCVGLIFILVGVVIAERRKG